MRLPALRKAEGGHKNLLSHVLGKVLHFRPVKTRLKKSYYPIPNRK
ncbi:hypothetical protein M2M59_01085 [Rummeliibacillus sp. G93]|nr:MULTISPECIES: hypothetical protein [Rummeliibacillus]MBB5170627.1 hypothetical protein [Rummeliibacillus stabekisii]MCM3315100.1 hypothetical protein [Rummeliibacillus stabekisii]UQW97630.1 hypothetical protein M2M59_01085 [Rummeliibacillus sp. G93]GEL04883.1 hypothetical protein RST01_15100 [Rummeliibacillus stabekisii]